MLLNGGFEPFGSECRSGGATEPNGPKGVEHGEFESLSLRHGKIAPNRVLFFCHKATQRDSNPALSKTSGGCFVAVTEGFCEAYRNKNMLCLAKFKNESLSLRHGKIAPNRVLFSMLWMNEGFERVGSELASGGFQEPTRPKGVEPGEFESLSPPRKKTIANAIVFFQLNPSLRTG